MLFHLFFLAITIYHVLANSAHIASAIYSGSNCLPGSGSSMISGGLIQEFDAFSPYYGPGIPITSQTAICVAYYNITLDEPGRVMVNDRAMQVLGYTKIDKNATLVVQVQYIWHGPNIGVSSFVPALDFPS